MSETQTPAVRLFIDCDPGIDDFLALTYAFAHPQVQVEGIVATGGNVGTEQVGKNVRGILELLKDKAPAAAQTKWALGALNPLAKELETTEETHGDYGVGYADIPLKTEPLNKPLNEGAQLWLDAANAAPGELDAVLLGPATNLALALRRDPDLLNKLRSLYIMGGAINHRGNTMPTTEWNVHSDPEALYEILQAASKPETTLKPVLCPLDATETMEMHPATRASLVEGKENNPLFQAIDDALRFYMEFHEEDGHGYMAHVHDPFVLALTVQNSLREKGDTNAQTLGGTVSTVLDVELDGKLTRGQTIADWLGRWNRDDNALVLKTTEPEKFFEHYLETVRATFAAPTN